MSIISANDLTKGNPSIRLLQFTIPFLLAFLLQVLYGTVDVVIIGHFGGGSAGVSAVASGSEVMHLVASLVMGLTTGATVMIGNYYGAKRYDDVNKCIGMTITLSSILAIIMTIVMYPLIPTIATWLRTPAEAFEMTINYARICTCGIFFIFGYNALSAIFRGLGNSIAPLLFVGIACLINIGGDLLLVVKYQLGVTGVAIATITSQALSMIFAIVFLHHGKFGFKCNRRYFGINWHLAWKFAKVGVPIGLQGIIIGLSFMFIFGIVNSMGVASSAGYGICNKINGFAMLPAVAFSMAMSAITAQNIGAGLEQRAITTLRLGISYAMLFGTLALIYLQLLPRQIVELFLPGGSPDSEAAIQAAIQHIRSFSWEFILVPIVFCTNGFFTGCGRAFFSMANNICSTFFVRLPAAYFLSQIANATLFEVGFAAPSASLVSNIVALIYLASGRWKKTPPKTSAATGINDIK